MFKKKFIDELKNIEPSEEIKAAVLLKMKQEREKRIPVSSRSKSTKRWITALAMVLVVIIASVTVFNLPIFDGNDYIGQTGSEYDGSSENSSIAAESIENESVEENSTQLPPKDVIPNTTYNEVYKLFEEIDAKRTEQSGHSNGWSNVYTEGNSSSLSASKGGSSDNSNENSTSASTSKNYTKTNVQVEGVDEGDIVKTDGEYIYYLDSSDVIYVVRANEGKLSKKAVIEGSDSPYRDLYDYNYYDYEAKYLYLCGDTLVVIFNARRNSKNYKGECTLAMLFDVSNPESPKYKMEYVQTGGYVSSRLIGDKLYVFSTDTTYTLEKVELPDGNYERKKVWRLPQVGTDNKVLKPIDEKNLYVFDGEVNLEYFLAVSIDLTSEKMVDCKGVIGGGGNVYVNNNSIYAVSSEVNYFDTEKDYIPKTYIIKFALSSGKILPLAKANVKGTVINQFLMDEWGGYFRIITTTRKYRRNPCCGFLSVIGVEENNVYVLDKNLKTVGSINGIAKEEAVTSSRFMGKIGYFCTSPLDVNTDPFFAVDFSKPEKPKLLDSLEFPGVVDYLHPYGSNMMLGIGETENTNCVKLMMFDISDPKSIKIISTLNTSISCANISFNGTSSHKMVNVLSDKNIICFPGGNNYNVFTFNRKNGFEVYKGKSFPVQTNVNGEFSNYYECLTRGIFIDNYLYVCNVNGIIAYLPFEDGKKTSEIKF